MESDRQQRTWHDVSKLWRGKKVKTVEKVYILIGMSYISPKQHSFEKKKKIFQHFLELNTKYLCFIFIQWAEFSLCVHIQNACAWGTIPGSQTAAAEKINMHISYFWSYLHL